jgi:hypothetical protein
MSSPWWQLSLGRVAHYSRHRDHRSSLVRALDEGGLVWESSDEHESVDEALQALEVELAEGLE